MLNSVKQFVDFGLLLEIECQVNRAHAVKRREFRSGPSSRSPNVAKYSSCFRFKRAPRRCHLASSIHSGILIQLHHIGNLGGSRSGRTGSGTSETFEGNWLD